MHKAKEVLYIKVPQDQLPVMVIDESEEMSMPFNTLRPRQNRHRCADNIFKCIFLNENASIAIKISLKFVANDPINNIPALVQIMAWHRPGDKPLSEPMIVSLPTHICVTRPQWVIYQITLCSMQVRSLETPAFHEEWFQIPQSSQGNEIVKKMDTFFLFLQSSPACQGLSLVFIAVCFCALTHCPLGDMVLILNV